MKRHRTAEAELKPSLKARFFICAVWTLCILGVFTVTSFFVACESMGGRVSDDMKDRKDCFSRYRDGKFENITPTAVVPEGAFAMMKEWFFGGQQRTPPSVLPVEHLPQNALSTPVLEGMRFVWLGHAGVLLEIDGVRLLIDPVFSNRVSPLPVGPKRFHPSPIALDHLPPIDAVLISHDHYDHLDMAVIKHFRHTETRFFVPLGVAAHLKKWKMPADQIMERDWWEPSMFGPLTIVCTPARHFSGRRLFDRNDTLWASWTIVGPVHKSFYGGDSGFSDHFAEIGKRFGPFDLTILKIGAYDKAWPDIHTTPEEAVEAHRALGGKQMLPVHWATFNLAFHAWDAPIQRAIASAAARNVALITPRAGEIVDLDHSFVSDHWWEAVK